VECLIEKRLRQPGSWRHDAAMTTAATKPFAISRREQFTLLTYLNPLESADQEERRSRRAVWDEFQILQLKRTIDRLPTEKDPNPTASISVFDWADEEPNVRLEIHGSTIAFVIKKLNGKLVGGAGDVLGDLADRLIALRDTPDPATICTRKGSGYHLPEALWTEPELAAATPLQSVPPDAP
jgi:hypothetical protein